MVGASAVLGKVIKKHRERVGLSQEDLATYSGLNRTFIGEVERGETNPSFETLLKIAATLQVELSAMVADYERILFEESDRGSDQSS